jgi:hypothetical protein
VDRYYTLLRATSSSERQCATIDNKGGGEEGVRERFVLGGTRRRSKGAGTREGDTETPKTQIYLVYIEGDDKTEGSPHPPRGSG